MQQTKVDPVNKNNLMKINPAGKNWPSKQKNNTKQKPSYQMKANPADKRFLIKQKLSQQTKDYSSKKNTR